MRVYRVELFPDEEFNAKFDEELAVTGASISSVEVDEMPADTDTIFYFDDLNPAIKFVRFVFNCSNVLRNALAPQLTDNNNNNPTDEL